MLDLEVTGDIADTVREALERMAPRTTLPLSREDELLGSAARRRPSQRNGSFGDGSESEFSDADCGAGDGKYDMLCEIPLWSVIFQQGINEYQAMANTGIAGNTEFQHVVNEESLCRLENYFMRYTAVAKSQAQTSRDRAELGEEEKIWSDLLVSIQKAVQKKMKTNVHLILHTTDLCRQLSGCHGICCKSGKDRTSMAVTLDEARNLCDHMHVVGGRKACKVIRRFGLRRSNVNANTGQTKFAFNPLQRSFLPKCFQPPGGTYSGNIVT